PGRSSRRRRQMARMRPLTPAGPRSRKFAQGGSPQGVGSVYNTGGAGRYGVSGSGLKKRQAGTPVLRRGAFPGVQARCETVGKGRYPIFETTSGVVLGGARILIRAAHR